MRPTTHAVTSLHHQGQGIDALNETQFDKLAGALGFKDNDMLSDTGKIMRRGAVQSYLNTVVQNDLEGWLAIGSRQQEVAAVFGCQSPDRMTHVGQIEQRALLAKKLSDLAL